MTSTELKRSVVQLSLSGPTNEHNKHPKALIIRNEAQVAGNTNRLVLFNLVGEMMEKVFPSDTNNVPFSPSQNTTIVDIIPHIDSRHNKYLA